MASRFSSSALELLGMTDPTTEYPDLELPSDYREAIGTLTANATILDHTVDHAIWAFLRVSPIIGRLITEPIVSTSRKIALMRGIGKIIAKDDPKISKQWAEVGGKVSGANSLRTQIVHARWLRRDKDGVLHISRFEEGVEDPIVESMPIGRLRGYCDEIAIAQRQLLAFLQTYQLEVTKTGTHSWPPRYRGRKKS
jgi:hypothetical protein